jgi:hypothetical protein
MSSQQRFMTWRKQIKDGLLLLVILSKKCRSLPTLDSPGGTQF